MTSAPDTIEPYLLTMREWQCAHLFVQGCNNSEIARRLKCSAGLVASMLQREGVRAHIAEAAIELATKERITEEWLYAQAAEVVRSPASTGAEKVAAMRLLSRWKGMEIERVEVTDARDPVDALERARKRALAAEQQNGQDTDPTRQRIDGHVSGHDGPLN